MSDEQPERASDVSGIETGDKIERIREILVGGSLDEFNLRLGHAETRLQAVDSSLREEIARCLSSIDVNVTARLEESLRAEAELRQKLSDEVDALRNELAQVRVELQSSMKEALAELDREKVDRAALSRILSEVSLRLGSESAPADRESSSNG